MPSIVLNFLAKMSYLLKVFKFCRIYNSTDLLFCKVVSGDKTKKKRKSDNNIFILQFVEEKERKSKKRIEFWR